MRSGQSGALRVLHCTGKTRCVRAEEDRLARQDKNNYWSNTSKSASHEGTSRMIRSIMAIVLRKSQDKLTIYQSSCETRSGCATLYLAA